MNRIINIAVFASHNGSDLQAIIDECKSGNLNARVCAVISNNSSARALSRARDNQIPAFHISEVSVSVDESVDSAILKVLENERIDIIILAGYLKKLGESILKKYSGHIYNIHPSLLPKFGGRGMYGINVHKAVLAAGEEETGITIHEVNEKYDDGKIVAQTRVPVYSGDTPELLAERVLENEHVFLRRILQKIVDEYEKSE